MEWQKMKTKPPYIIRGDILKHWGCYSGGHRTVEVGIGLLEYHDQIVLAVILFPSPLLVHLKTAFQLGL